MELNYLIIFIVTCIITSCIILYLTKEKFSFNYKYILWAFIISPGIANFWICSLFYMFSSTVYEIKPNKEYKKSDYILYYKDNKGVHIVVPFTNYLSNNSNREVIISPIAYGNYEQKQKNEYFKIGEFKSLVNKPDYIFEEPPLMIRTKNRGGVARYVLNYK